MMRKMPDVILLCAFIAAVGFVSITECAAQGKAARQKKTAAVAASKKTPAEKDKEAAAPQENIPVKYTGMESKRDPFALPLALAKALERPKELKAGAKVEEGVSLPKIDIQGVIWSAKMPQAIVNNAVMRVGDFIELFEIKEITQSSIILFLKGREYEIKIQTPAATGIKPGRKP